MLFRVIIPREDILNVVTLLGGPMVSFDAISGPNKSARPVPPTVLSLCLIVLRCSDLGTSLPNDYTIIIFGLPPSLAIHKLRLQS